MYLFGFDNLKSIKKFPYFSFLGIRYLSRYIIYIGLGGWKKLLLKTSQNPTFDFFDNVSFYGRWEENKKERIIFLDSKPGERRVKNFKPHFLINLEIRDISPILTGLPFHFENGT